MSTPRDEASLGKAYTAPAITVYFDPGRCRHYAECVRGLPQVFDTSRRPWISADPAGPLLVRGDLALDTPDGTRHDTRAALCRCGRTELEPFCDGACGVNQRPATPA